MPILYHVLHFFLAFYLAAFWNNALLQQPFLHVFLLLQTLHDQLLQLPLRHLILHPQLKVVVRLNHALLEPGLRLTPCLEPVPIQVRINQLLPL